MSKRKETIICRTGYWNNTRGLVSGAMAGLQRCMPRLRVDSAIQINKDIRKEGRGRYTYINACLQTLTLHGMHGRIVYVHLVPEKDLVSCWGQGNVFPPLQCEEKSMERRGEVGDIHELPLHALICAPALLRCCVAALLRSCAPALLRSCAPALLRSLRCNHLPHSSSADIYISKDEALSMRILRKTENLVCLTHLHQLRISLFYLFVASR